MPSTFRAESGRENRWTGDQTIDIGPAADESQEYRPVNRLIRPVASEMQGLSFVDLKLSDKLKGLWTDALSQGPLAGRNCENVFATHHLGLNFYLPVVRELTTGAAPFTPAVDARPLRVLFLTSIRDVGAQEFVGLECGGSRLVGTIENAFRGITDGGYGQYLEIAGIVTDDMPKDLVNSDYAALPRAGKEWIFDRELKNGAGDAAVDITFNIPSTFRGLRMSDTQRRREHKLEFEYRVIELMRELEADVIVSDHFMAKIDHMIAPDGFGLFGRVLNTHPAMLRKGHASRSKGKEPYLDVLTLLRENRGGDPQELRTGATLHLVADKIDGGPIICDGALTKVYQTDSEAALIARNYPNKNRVFLEGMTHYALNIFPLLAPLE